MPLFTHIPGHRTNTEANELFTTRDLRTSRAAKGISHLSAAARCPQKLHLYWFRKTSRQHPSKQSAVISSGYRFPLPKTAAAEWGVVRHGPQRGSGTGT